MSAAPSRALAGAPDSPGGRAGAPAHGLPGALAALRGVATVALGVLALTWLLRLGVELGMGVPLEHRFWLRDYAGNLAVALLAGALIRRTVPTLAFAGLVVTAFHLINAGKLLVLGVPGSPDDFLNIVNLYHLSEGWLQRAFVVAVGAMPFALLAVLVRWRSGVTWAAIFLMVAGVWTLVAQAGPVQRALDARFGHSVWNQPENFRHRGLALHLVQESLRTIAKVGRTPSLADVDAAVDGLPLAAPDIASIAAAPRNVHVILLESFFDPVSLGPEWVPDDPFPPELRALWAETGESLALSPVFGGYTANAEFEALCGFPVTENAVFFEGWLRREAPCLPSLLADAGYRTVASHPNVPGFWNRTHAYRLTGFDEYLSKSSFDTTDSVGSFMLDHAFYEQVFEQLGTADPRPVFNYMLTYHGHLPYPNSPAYPDRVAPGREAPLLNGYLNHLWYKSRDLVERLEVLREEDPDALIVAFGDHLPFLDPNYGVYTEAFGLPADRKDFSGAQFERLVSTPLIVIDGERGPVDVGKVPLYRLPSLILELLGSKSDGMFAWSANPDGRLYRPVYGMHFEVPATDGAVTGARAPIACPPEAPEDGCADGMAWLARVRTLIADTFTGDQFGLGRLESTATSASARR